MEPSDLKDCDLCRSPYYPKGKCPRIRWEGCVKRKDETKTKDAKQEADKPADSNSNK